MSYRTIAVLGSGALVLVIGGLLGPRSWAPGVQAAPPQEPGEEPVPPALRRPDPVPPPDEPPDPNFQLKDYIYTTDQAIQFFEARAKRDPTDFTNRRYLGQFYDRKGKESGDPRWFERAEAVLREADELFPGDPRTGAALAVVLCSRHKFAEALAIAEGLRELDPESIDVLAVLADAQVGLGRYEDAEATLRELHRLAAIPPVLARLANLSEVKGRIEEAMARMQSAAEAARANGGAKPAAWYEWRLGDLAFSAGRLEEAEAHYLAVPEGVDAYHDATAGLARVRAAQGKADEAIALYEKAVAIGPDPHMVTGLAELYRRAGREDEAEALLRDLEAQLKDRPDERRHLALLYCDEGRELAEALELARLDFESRQDVDAHATLAWALHKNGRQAEAVEAIDRALAVGTRDALLHYRAGVIHQAAGDAERAVELLREALAINPHFSPTLADDARQRLRSLGDPE